MRGREAAKKAEREGLRGGDEIWQDGERYFCVWERCEWKGRKKKNTLLNDKLFLVCAN